MQKKAGHGNGDSDTRQQLQRMSLIDTNFAMESVIQEGIMDEEDYLQRS